jgi:hypothetical protein
LDTVLYLIGPDGRLLERAQDSILEDGSRGSDAKIPAFIAPLDGTYRLEARSHLDDHAGGYTLILVKPDPIVIDQAILETYVGHYIEGPWQFDVRFYIRNGHLFAYTEQMQQENLMIPISITEFVLGGEGGIFAFSKNQSGQVDGYDTYVSTINPDNGGKWFRAEKVDQ